MASRSLSRLLGPSTLLVVASCALGQSLFAQGPLPDAPTPVGETASPIAEAPLSVTEQHKFWDRENYALFAAAAALNSADFTVTRANLQSGGRELNPLVRPFSHSTAGLVANFAAETTGVIGLSYFFHKTGHHRLERIVPVVSIGSAAGAVSYGLAHR